MRMLKRNESANSFSSPEAAVLLVSTKNRDFWPVPIFEHAQKKSLYNFQPIRFVSFDNESVNRGLPVLGAARGLRRFLVLTKRIAASGDENGANSAQVIGYGFSLLSIT